MPSGWSAVFLDFDGVVLDSVEVKTRAFARLYREHGTEVERKVVAHHLAHCGMSRFEKIRIYHSDFLGREPEPSELDALCRDFSDLVLDKVLASPPMPGAMESLETLRQEGTPCFLVSGTPEEELRLIVSRLGLGRFFLEVHGSPGAKADMLRDILARHSLRPGRCLFIGDGLVDHAAAKGCGLHFLGILRKGEDSLFPEGTTTSDRIFIPPAAGCF